MSCVSMSLNYIFTDFPLPLLRLHEKVENCFLSANVQRSCALAGRTCVAFCLLVGFPLSALGCPWVKRRRKGPHGLLRSSATVKEKGKKCCFIHLWTKCGSTYCQENFLIVSEEVKETWLSNSQGWRRTSDWPKQFPSPEEEKDQRHKERGSSRLPSCLLSEFRELYRKMIRFCSTRHLSKHESL